jgi:hypothetical protein
MTPRKPTSHMRIPCNGKSYSISYEDIASLIISAYEDGTSFIVGMQVVSPSRWTYSDPDYTVGNKHSYTDYPLNPGGALKITCDNYDDAGEKVCLLNLASIRKGLTLLAQSEEHRFHFMNIVEENADAYTGNAFLQLALFGEMIYVA